MLSSTVSLSKSAINSGGATSLFRFDSAFFAFFTFDFDVIFLFLDSLPTGNTMAYSTNEKKKGKRTLEIVDAEKIE